MKTDFLTKLFCSSFILVIMSQKLLATDVSGTIVNQTWTSNNSPYRVVGNILVAGLTIKPGVTVQFASNYVFEIAGVLKANGTATAPIVFMGTNGGWQGIFFNFSSPGSILAYCTISNSVNSGIRIVDAQPTIVDCVIANNSGANGGGIFANIAVGDMVVQDCNISNNTASFNGGGVGVILATNYALRMDGCSISGNVANPASNIGNYFGGGIWVSGASILRNCVVRNNFCKAQSGFSPGEAWGGGIYSDGSADIRNCIVSDNQATSFTSVCCGSWGPYGAYGGGIVIGSGSLSMTNTIISSNITASSYSSIGGGLFLSTVQSASLVNCTLAYNNTEGLYSQLVSAKLLNSIVYFNASSGTQIVGTTNVTYCDVQNGFTGTGNINANPVFLSTSDLIIVPGSPCINKGITNAVYNDVLFPPSLGSSRNDMGAHGGPGAGARMRIGVNPQIKVAFLGGVPGYTYLIQASTNLLDWQTVQQVPIAHVGDVSYFLEPTTNTLPHRFYKLNLAP